MHINLHEIKLVYLHLNGIKIKGRDDKLGDGKLGVGGELE